MLEILVCVNVTLRADGIDAMNTSIRNRAAVLALATAASLAGVGITGGPALASTNAETNAEVTGADTDEQKPASAQYPTDPVDYADEFVRAFGADERDRVSSLATGDAVAAAYSHDYGYDDPWVRTGSRVHGDTEYVDYTNTKTKTRLSVRVRIETAADAQPDAVDSVEFITDEVPS